MENTLLMRTEASYSLNFLIYIQNIYLNQSQGMDELKFPYIPTKYKFKSDFEIQFGELWEDVTQRISDHPINDQKIFHEEKNSFYQSLFNESDVSLHDFNEIYQSFKVWWGSLAGHFSVERSIDDFEQKMYTELANLLLEEQIQPQKELDISLLYDECVLVDVKPSSYFVILSIRDCIVNNKEVLPRLVRSIS